MRTTDEGDQPGFEIHTQRYHAGRRRVEVEWQRVPRRVCERDPGQGTTTGPAAVSRTEGEMPAATCMCSEKPGPLSLASWDHVLVAIAH
jgi:hypothetical protein